MGFGPDVALCLGACDATQIINGCAPREICLPFDDAVPEDAACLPGDDACTIARTHYGYPPLTAPEDRTQAL